MAKKVTKRSPGRKVAKKAAKKAVKKSAAKPVRKAAAKSRAMHGPRKDHGASAEVYLAQLGPGAREIAQALHAAIMRAGDGAAQPGGQAFACALKWGYPTYTVAGQMVAQLYDTKAGVAVRFMSGLRPGGLAPTLDDPAGLLDRSGKAPCIRVGTIAEANSDGLRRVVESAVRT